MDCRQTFCLLLAATSATWLVSSASGHIPNGASLQGGVRILADSFASDRGWYPVGGGRIHVDRRRGVGAPDALLITASGRSDAGVQHLGLGGILGHHRIRISAWVMGGPSAIGKRVRLQLNEVRPGLHGSDVQIAVARTRLTPEWQQLTATGVTRANGDSVVPIVVLERAQRGSRFWLDNYTLLGDPGSVFRPSIEGRAPVHFLADGFDSGDAAWYAVGSARIRGEHQVVESGRGAIAIIATRPSDAGMQHPGIGGAVGGHRLWVTAWVKGTPSTFGKRFRIQLNEVGGSGLRTIAVAWIKLGRKWARITASGRTSFDTGPVVPIAVVERAPKGGVAFVDDYQVAGDPGSMYTAAIIRPVHNRAPLWELAALWAAALMVAAAVYARSRRNYT